MNARSTDTPTTPYSTPKVTDHGDLQMLTAKFGGALSDVIPPGANTTPAGNSQP